MSIYLRTTPLTQETKSNRIELKNLLKTALDEMTAAGIDKRSILPIEADVTDLIEDDDFWVTQANSLAIFATPERILTFQLGSHVTNLVEVSDRFHLKPLLRAVTFPHTAYVLALSMGAVRLVEVTPDNAPREVTVPSLPKSMADALGRRSHQERSGDMNKAEESSENALLTRYSRVIDKALRVVLTGQHRPLIIAAAEPLASVFRHVCSYHNLAAHVIPGSADRTPDHELATAAQAVLDNVYAGDIAAFHELYAQRTQQGRATTDITQAARAATYGAVDTLIVDMDTTISGFIDDEGAVTLDDAPDAVNYGVVDEIARRTLQAGGKVIAARRDDIPGKADLAAVLRYAF
ncbi:hypothetical protein HQ394_10945 [Defluviicoccus vanus]|uniref:Chemotaxis protein n=1 Tax=Defluviicoccus vanus TaxID=111831 RepID=A0A7H1N203_9PROT|nr:hypothetical protein HQ394_10945 [Defluviicoccus vanus]